MNWKSVKHWWSFCHFCVFSEQIEATLTCMYLSCLSCMQTQVKSHLHIIIFSSSMWKQVHKFLVNTIKWGSAHLQCVLLKRKWEFKVAKDMSLLFLKYVPFYSPLFLMINVKSMLYKGNQDYTKTRRCFSLMNYTQIYILVPVVTNMHVGCLNTRFLILNYGLKSNKYKWCSFGFEIMKHYQWIILEQSLNAIRVRSIDRIICNYMYPRAVSSPISLLSCKMIASRNRKCLNFYHDHDLSKTAIWDQICMTYRSFLSKSDLRCRHISSMFLIFRCYVRQTGRKPK